MKKILFLIVFISGCATIKSLIKKGSFEIHKEKFFYVNWFVPAKTITGIVNGVYDGDTIYVETEGLEGSSGEDVSTEGFKVRLIGVDTPEIAHPEQGYDTDEPGAREAMAYTTQMINWRKVLLVVDPKNEYDSYGRTLALVFYKDKKGTMRCHNWELLKRNYARLYLWETDFLCNKKYWKEMARVRFLKSESDYRKMGILCLKEKNLDDALYYYRKGLKKFPYATTLRRDIAVLYMKLFRAEKNREKKRQYRTNAIYHWEKLIGTKYDRIARENLEKINW